MKNSVTKNRIINFKISALALAMFILAFCSRDRISELPAKGQSPEAVSANTAVNTAAQANSFLDKLASEISKVPDQKFFQTISDKALEEKDGDRDFIYHVDKADPAISEQFKAIEQTLGKAAFDKLPLLNVYVYAPYTPDNADKKPRIYYWPLGKAEKDIKEVIGYREGQQITADGQTAPSATEGAIFVIGINERVTYEEKQEGRSSILLEDGQKLLGSSDKYNFFLPGDYSKDGATRNLTLYPGFLPGLLSPGYGTVYSRFASMSALRDYESWGLGEAEVGFFNLSNSGPFPFGVVNGGYTRCGFLCIERFSADNNRSTAEYVPLYMPNARIAVWELDGKSPYIKWGWGSVIDGGDMPVLSGNPNFIGEIDVNAASGYTYQIAGGKFRFRMGTVPFR